MSSFVTDAHGRGASCGPWTATSPSGPTTASATEPAPQPSAAARTDASNGRGHGFAR